ncbi:MAG: GAF domain-containing sensor histidine kinase [Thermoflexales bacterium]|nr:GAF domain-containing sensor histidine kinase [Thermoflexales bacterium]
MVKRRRNSTADKSLRAQLEALHEATLTITAELSLDHVLQHVVHLARELVNARYAALGLPDTHGKLERFLYSGLTAEQATHIGPFPQGQGILGEMLRSTQAIRLRDIAEHPHSAGFSQGHPAMTSFLRVPIVSKDNVLGTLYLTNKLDDGEFSADDEKVIVMLAAHAAIAIKNARLYQQIQRLAIFEERERIGMDLHDGIIQSIYAVGLTLEYGNLLLDEDPAQAKQHLGQAISSLNEVIKDIRNYILDLRPQRFQDKDLATGLDELARAFHAHTLIQADVQVESGSDLTPSQASGLFHIAQEALANVAKHARANTVSVKLYDGHEHICLSIADDGRGYDPSRASRHEGHGLSNMQARARALGGKLTVDSAPGHGTRVEVQVPLHAAGERLA